MDGLLETERLAFPEFGLDFKVNRLNLLHRDLRRLGRLEELQLGRLSRLPRLEHRHG